MSVCMRGGAPSSDFCKQFLLLLREDRSGHFMYLARSHDVFVFFFHLAHARYDLVSTLVARHLRARMMSSVGSVHTIARPLKSTPLSDNFMPIYM